jgi:phage terminase small subunit
MAGLTHRQQKFCDEYLKHPVATDAAIKAGYSEKYAGQNADKLLKNTKVREYLNSFQKNINQKNIKSVEEVQEWWTSIIEDGEETTKDRLRASELLVKSKGGFTENINVKGNTKVVIVDDIENDT